MESTETTRKLGFFVLIGLLFFSVHYTALSEPFPQRDYEFEVEARGETDSGINRYHIYYDFTQRKGHMSMTLLGYGNVSYVNFYVPDEVAVTNVTWSRSLPRKDLDEVIYADVDPDGPRHGEPASVRVQPDVTGGLNNLTFFFEGDMYPRGEFWVLHQMNDVRPQQGDNRGIFFEYYYGDIELECGSPAIAPGRLQDKDLELDTTETSFTVSTPTVDGDPTNVQRTRLFDLRCSGLDMTRLLTLAAIGIAVTVPLIWDFLRAFLNNQKFIGRFLESFGKGDA